MSFRANARNLVTWQRCFADAQHDIIIIPKRYRENLMLLSLGWRFLKEESFRMTVMSFRVYTRNLVLLPLEKRFSSPTVVRMTISVTSFPPQRSNQERSPARYRVFLPPASLADGAAELTSLKQSSPAFRLLPRSRQPDKGGHFPTPTWHCSVSCITE